MVGQHAVGGDNLLVRDARPAQEGPRGLCGRAATKASTEGRIRHGVICGLRSESVHGPCARSAGIRLRTRDTMRESECCWGTRPPITGKSLPCLHQNPALRAGRSLAAACGVAGRAERDLAAANRAALWATETIDRGLQGARRDVARALEVMRRPGRQVGRERDSGTGR